MNKYALSITVHSGRDWADGKTTKGFNLTVVGPLKRGEVVGCGDPKKVKIGNQAKQLDTEQSKQ